MDPSKNPQDFFKCSRCKHYLSVFPIRHLGNEITLCGRCPKRSNNEIRTIICETMAQKMKFPCKNRGSGCRFVANPDLMRTHESNCKYVQWHCFENCNWKGFLSDFRKHYEEKHGSLFKTPGEFFDLNFVSGRTCGNACFLWMEQFFLFRLGSDGCDLYAAVYLIDTCETSADYVFKLFFRIGSSLLIELPEETVTDVIRVNTWNKIDLNKINSRDITACKIAISNKNYLNLKQTSDKRKISAIFSYISLCDECQRSPKTKEVFQKIASATQFPCGNPGCNLKLNIEDRFSHKTTCRYQLYNCPYLKCSFRGKFEPILSHVMKVHKYVFDEIEMKIAHRKKTNLLIINDHIFLQSTENDNCENFRISFKLFGPMHSQSIFFIQVNLVNSVQDEHIFIKTTQTVSLPFQNLDDLNWSLHIRIVEDVEREFDLKPVNVKV